MTRVVVSNQRGGVSKTTTTTTIAREFADRGKRVLVIDTDPQGSISSILNLKPQHNLYNFVIERLRFEDCIVPVSDSLHVLCSSRETTKVEAILMGQTAREHSFVHLFSARSTSARQRAMASIEASKSLNQLLNLQIHTVGLLPVMVDRRLAMTSTVIKGLEGMSQGLKIPLLPAIRTDQSVTKAARAAQFLADFDPKCKAMEDYKAVANELETILKV